MSHIYVEVEIEDYEIVLSGIDEEIIIEATVKAQVFFEKDSDYGADADGNRGVVAFFETVEDISILDKDGNCITEMVISDLSKELMGRLEDDLCEEGREKLRDQ